MNVFYEAEAENHRYLEGYDNYDKKQMRKMTHVEKFHYDVAGNCEEKEGILLFDYRNRNRLTHQASVFQL